MKIKVIKIRRIASLIEEILKTENPDRFAKNRYLRNNESSKNVHYTFESLNSAEGTGDREIDAKSLKIKKLLDSLFNLRFLVKKFNFETKIEQNTNMIAMSEEKIAHREGLLRKFKAPMFEPANDKFSSGISDEKREEIQQEILELKQKIRELKDENAFINASNTIDVDDETVATLKEFKLLA